MLHERFLEKQNRLRSEFSFLALRLDQLISELQVDLHPGIFRGSRDIAVGIGRFAQLPGGLQQVGAAEQILGFVRHEPCRIAHVEQRRF